MLLILTNSQDATADFLLPILEASGIQLRRLDTDRLLRETVLTFRPGNAVLTVETDELTPAQIDNIWYRRPEQLKDERFRGSPEDRYAIDEWSEAIEGFLAHVPMSRWMNHPSANAIASHKLEQLTLAASLGFAVPDTLVTQDASDARQFWEQCDGHVVVKPMASGYIERSGHDDSLIYTNPVERQHLDSLDDLAHCPTLFQKLVPKSSDVRITIVDGDVHAVKLQAADESGSQRCDIRRNNMTDVRYSGIDLPDSIRLLLRRLVTHYGLRFGAIDMAIDLDGEWHFLELNPNGQWAWLDLTADTKIANSFVKAFSDVSRGH